MTEPIAVFVGSSPWSLDAESDLALEYSIRKHASRPVEIVWMRHGDDPSSPWGGWNRECWATPFSGFRWSVAEVALSRGYARAIYTDNDVLFLADIAELWDMDFEGRPVIAREPWRFCVSVWDCEAAALMLPPIAEQKQDSVTNHRLHVKFGDAEITRFPPAWNCLDGEDMAIEAVKALHFTDMSTQPAAELADRRLRELPARNAMRRPRKHWYRGPRNKHRRPEAVALFHQYYREAVEGGETLGGYRS